VQIRGGAKQPEFLWHTRLGQLYCECKRADDHEAAYRKLASRLYEHSEATHRAQGLWNPAYRVDISIVPVALNGVEGRITKVIREAFTVDSRTDGQTEAFADGEVQLLLRPRDESPPDESDTIRTSSVDVSTVPTRLSYENADLTFTMSLATYRQRVTTKLLREARRQLPPEDPGAIFIQLGGVTAAAARLRQVLVDRAYERTPWVCLCDPGMNVQGVWRNGQPFDGRLLTRRPQER
jgi:hypothetical protein